MSRSRWVLAWYSWATWLAFVRGDLPFTVAVARIYQMQVTMGGSPWDVWSAGA